jgi:hypothetical protein
MAQLAGLPAPNTSPGTLNADTTILLTGGSVRRSAETK